MQYSIVNYKNAFSRFDERIDAEFFSHNYIKVDNIIRKNKYSILEIKSQKITDGTHYTPSYVNEGKPFLSALNVKENYLDVDCDYKFISNQEHAILYKRCNPKAGDVLLRKVGVGPRYAAVVPKGMFEFSLFVSVALIKTKEFNPYYLSTFINSKYGQTQLLRFNKGISQPDLHLEDIGKLEVPSRSEDFQRKIETICCKSENNLILSKQNYQQAEDLLLEELELKDWKPKQTLFFVKNFSDTQSANRIDAEYFQPKYDDIIAKIKSYSSGWDKLENLVNIKDKNFNPESQKSYKYIELSNISNSGEITRYTEEQAENLPSRARRIIKSNDVIISSIEGSLESIALITESYNNSLCSNGFYVLNSDYYNSETLLCLMKTCIGQLQLKKGCNGTILTAINKEEISKIVLPKIRNEIQTEIKNKISGTYKLKHQSKQLLEIAKRGVEMAIEQDENIATAWINEEILKLKISL